jgi:pyruvate,water dikinase
LRKAKKSYALRERNRSDITRVGEELRKFILELGRRFADRGWIDARSDMFFLVSVETEAAIANPSQGPELGRRVAERKRRQQELSRIDVPSVIDGRARELTPAFPAHTSPSRAPVADVLHGQCISSGIAEGEVVVIREPTDFARMKPGAILVAPATDPAWTPLFVQAAGVIVEVGGQISHAAIVTRELGLPALANVRHAATLLRDGDVIKLDATGGTVEIVTRVPRP